MNECMNERMGKTMMIHDITDFPMITKIVPYMYMSFPLYAPWNLGISQPCLTPLRQSVPCAFPGGGERRRTLQDGGTTPLADLLGIAELVIFNDLYNHGFCGYLW